MIENISGIKKFKILADAIEFIAETVETDMALELFNHTADTEKQAEKFVARPDHFVRFTFPALQHQFRIMDFRIRYKDISFPDKGVDFKLGGHDKELGHVHIDFVKRIDGWVINKIWQCR